MKRTFEEWMNQVDIYLDATVGLTHNDLADCCYRDWYDDGVSPKVAAKRALANEGF